MKLVLFKNVKYGYESVTEYVDEDSFPYDDDETVAISKISDDVEFQMLDKKELVSSQVTIIKKQITKVKADSEASITALNGKIQDLLALESDK